MDTEEKIAKRSSFWQYCGIILLVILVILFVIVILALLGPAIANRFPDYLLLD